MTDRAEDGATTLRERIEASWINRRLVLLVLVILLVIVGSGVGTIIFSGPSPPPADDETTSTPTPVSPTETATANPGSATPSDTATPSETPAEGTDVPDTPDENRGGGPSGGGSGSAPTPSPGLELGDDGPLLEAANLAPGSAGTGELTVRNAAGEDGTLTVSHINITDDENGIADAEESVDSLPGDGELSSHLEVRLSIQDGAGNEEYLFGTDSGYETLWNLSTSESSGGYRLESGETVTLVADWQLPTSTGNVVQSDRVLVDLGLTLESANP